MGCRGSSQWSEHINKDEQTQTSTQTKKGRTGPGAALQDSGTQVVRFAASWPCALGTVNLVFGFCLDKRNNMIPAGTSSRVTSQDAHRSEPQP